MSVIDRRYDTIIVGGGTAAFEAAVAARQSGAERVIILEKAPEQQAGGNSRYTTTGWRFVHSGAEEIRKFIPQISAADFMRMHIEPYTIARFREDLLHVTQRRIDPVLMEVLAGDSNSALHWLLDVGIQFEPTVNGRIIDGVHHFEPGCILAARGGRGSQYQQWQDIIAKNRVEIRYNSPVVAINGNALGVSGVRVLGPDREYDLEAGAVILCSGGFQADPEKRARYLGRNSDVMKVRGSRHNTGEVTMMALDLGAKASGQWMGAHASPVDRDAPADEMEYAVIRYSYVLGITVNALGARFFDEGEAESVYTYAKTGWAIHDQPGSVGFQIFDQKLLPLLRAPYANSEYVEAGSVGELATKIGIAPNLLEHTVAEYNRAVRDDIEFRPRERDGRCTTGIWPPRSNWATRLDSPPYRAYAVTGGITFTFGGLSINENAQVMNKMEQPIKGLYASGDILGLFYHNYPSFSGQTRNAVFSKRAGKHSSQGKVGTSA